MAIGHESSSLVLFKDLFCQIDWALLGLLKCSAHIFADNAKAEQLHGTEKQDQHDNRCVTWYIDTGNQLLQYYEYQIDQCGNTTETAQEGSNSQGFCRKTDDTVDCVITKLSKVPFALSGSPRTGSIRNVASPVADPCENAFAKAMIFTELNNAVCNAAAEGSEIAGIGF